MDPSSTSGGQETRPLDARFIGRYRVKRLLGSGGMGQVYLVHDPALDREAAVKLIGGSVDDADARRVLVQEARAAGRLRHPNIVTIFDAGEHEGSPYIAMEYVRGETLRSQIQRRAPTSLAQRLLCGEGACAGLAHAHRANVVHLDVKPDNLMLDADGVVKVLDFGIARVLQGESLQTQHMAGTLRYMSPEQASGGPIDRRSDVFSLGSSLFELVSYEAAYTGGPAAVVRRIASGPVPRLAEVVQPVDPRLDALIARAMSFDPLQRFDDLDELGEALGRLRRELEPDESARRSTVFVGVAQPSSASFLSGLAPPATAGSAWAQSVPPSSTWRGSAFAGAGVGVVLVAGLAVWMGWPIRPAPGTSPQPLALQPSENAASTGGVSTGTASTPSGPPAAVGMPLQPGPARVAPPPTAPADSASARGGSPAAPVAAVPSEEVWRRLAAGNRPGVLELLRDLERRENPPRTAYEVLEAVRPAAQQARADAAALPVSRGSASFRSGDESLARSSQMMQGRQPIEALVALWQALDVFAGATAEGRSAALTPAAPVTASPTEVTRATPVLPMPDVPKPVEEPPAVPAQIGDSENVLAALRRYHQAYTALDAAGIHQMYPALGAAQLEQLRRSFDAVTAYEIDVRQPRVNITGTGAVVRALVTRRIVPKVGRPVTSAVDTEFHLQRDARGWLIVGVKANP